MAVIALVLGDSSEIIRNDVDLPTRLDSVVPRGGLTF